MSCAHFRSNRWQENSG
uniref:Uncharacterized protein n=1 Tax=Arundo donax TaxID=35708 RepID=A0A0A9C229_ARUDO